MKAENHDVWPIAMTSATAADNDGFTTKVTDGADDENAPSEDDGTNHKELRPASFIKNRNRK